jgi:hypothetical protein
MKVKADRDESSSYAAMLPSQDVAQRCKVFSYCVKNRFVDKLVLSFLFTICRSLESQHCTLNSVLLVETKTKSPGPGRSGLEPLLDLACCPMNFPFCIFHSSELMSAAVCYAEPS